MNTLSVKSRIIILAVVALVLTTSTVQIVSAAKASIAARRSPVEVGVIKPWSVHPENRAAFRANPEAVA